MLQSTQLYKWGLVGLMPTGEAAYSAWVLGSNCGSKCQLSMFHTGSEAPSGTLVAHTLNSLRHGQPPAGH